MENICVGIWRNLIEENFELWQLQVDVLIQFRSYITLESRPTRLSTDNLVTSHKTILKCGANSNNTSHKTILK